MAAFALLVFAVPASAVESSGSDSYGFGVSPLRFDVDAPAGSVSKHSFTITNTDRTATRFTFSKEDFAGDKSDPGATPVLLGGKFESDISGYEWLSLPDPISIPPGQERTVSATVKSPAGATGGHYAALFVHGDSRSAGQIVAQSRIGLMFLMNAGGVPPPEIVITEIQEVAPGRVITRFENNGSTEVSPGGTIRENPRGIGPDRTIKGTCSRDVLPGAAGSCEFETGGSSGSSGAGESIFSGPVDKYVELIGDPGEEGTAARGELPTEWAGTWTSLLLPLVGVALFVLYFLFLRRRRKDEDGDEGGEIAWVGAPPA
jgi:hypothetical protein